MAKKSCKHCGIVPYDHVCPVSLKQRNKQYNSRDDKKIYNDPRWHRLREETLKDQDNICLWSMYVDGAIRHAAVVHHIVEILTDQSKAYDRDNVIGVSKEAHDIIHDLYKIDKQSVIKILLDCIRLWNDGTRAEGLGMLKGRLP